MFSDLSIGLSESFKFVVTENKINSFRDITGDTNPLHCDTEFAVEHGFVSRVCFGMLTASLFSTLGGVYLPGKYCIIQQVESKFVNPVYVGDELNVCGTVQELNESVQQAEIKVVITNQNGQKVLRGTLKVGFLE